MALAETANLLVNLSLGGNYVGGMTAAEEKTAAFNATATSGVGKAGALSGAFGAAGSATSKFGGALSHAGGQIKNLVMGPLGLLGLGAGLFGLAGGIEKGIAKAQVFGDEVRQLSAITGLAAPNVSALAAAMEHYGLSSDQAIRLTGFLEKNVGLLAARKDGLASFAKTYGLALTDQNGHLKDANDLILTTADYFNNKAIPATEKAAALSKLYGRSWQDMIPFLKAGRQGISDAEDEAQKLGLTLTQDNVTALAKMKTATRDLGTAMGGLELQVGLGLVPALTTFAKDITGFVAGHRTEIVGFFKGLGDFAQTAATTIGDLAGAAGHFWSSIPAPLRDLLVKGFVADRTVHFLFGFGATDIAKSLLGGLGGTLLSRGSPTNPMWVQMTGLGAGTGGLGGMGLLQALGIGTAILAVGYAVGEGIFAFLGGKKVGDPNYNPAGTPIGGTPFRIGAAQPYYKDPATGLPYRQTPSTFVNHTDALASVKPALNELGMAAMNLAGAGAFLSQAMQSATVKLAERLQHSVLPKSEVNAQLRAALRIANSSESTDQKIHDLEGIEKDLRTHGHNTSRYVLNLLNVERHKKTQFTANNYINIRVGTTGRVYRVSSTTLASDSMTNRPVAGGGIVNI